MFLIEIGGFLLLVSQNVLRLIPGAVGHGHNTYFFSIFDMKVVLPLNTIKKVGLFLLVKVAFIVFSNVFRN
jgi:hypothetical protein